jgi:hypothetical protein
MLRNGQIIPIVNWGPLEQGCARTGIQSRSSEPGFVLIRYGRNPGDNIAGAAFQGVLGSCIPTAR